MAMVPVAVRSRLFLSFLSAKCRVGLAAIFSAALKVGVVPIVPLNGLHSRSVEARRIFL